MDLPILRAAIVAMGAIAPRVPPAARAEMAFALAKEVEDTADGDTRGLMLISIGHLLAADLAEGGSAVCGTRTGDVVLRMLDAPLLTLRGYAALALGVGLRDLDLQQGPAAALELRSRATAQVAARAAKPMDPGERGAFVLATGLLRDTGAFGFLRGLVANRKETDELRADACLALGLVGVPATDSISVLRGALKDDDSGDLLRRHAAGGLGMLGDTGSSAFLVEELDADTSDYVLSQLVLGIGAIGDPASAGPLAKIVRDKQATDLLRAIACAGLGLLGDRERVPTLTRLGVDSNYLATIDALREAISLL
jgi:HEAT repeat protein